MKANGDGYDDRTRNGYITLPASVLRRLNATPFAPQAHLMADGSTFPTRVYHVTMERLGEEREIEVLALETNPLMGTALLADCHIDMEMSEGGEVIIESLA